MKQGVASDGALEHGLEGSELWEIHHLYNDYMSKTGSVDLVPVLNSKFEKENFKSNNAGLRGDFGDPWGYFVAPLIQGPVIPPGVVLTTISELETAATDDSSAKKKAVSDQPAPRGRPRKKKIPVRVPIPGDPDLDAGAEMLMTIPETGLSLKEAWRRMRTARRLLNDYDQGMPRKVKGEIRLYCRQHIAKADSSPAQQTLLERWTVDLMPGLSRAVQRMLEDKGQSATRKVLDAATPQILAAFQMLFPAAKIVGAAWHIRSGQLHLDIWSHTTRLEVVPHGLGTVLARLWDPNGLSHYGPGSGICAWDRHARALGERVHEIAPGLLEVVEQTMDRQSKTHGSKANRDVCLHRAVDEIFENLLPQQFQELGMSEYREWLQKQYSLGLAGPVARRAKYEKGIDAEIKLQALLEGLQKISGTFDDQKTRESGPIDPAETLAGFERWISKVLAEEKAKGKQDGLDEIRTLIEQAEDNRKESAEVLEKARALIDAAEFEGLRKARFAFLGESAPESSAQNVTDLALEFQREVAAKAELAIQERESGIVIRERELGERDNKLTSRESDVQEHERKLKLQEVDLGTREHQIKTKLIELGLREDNISTREKNVSVRLTQIEARTSALETLETEAVTRGLATAFRFLNPGTDPKSKTQAGILGEIANSVTKTVADKMMGVLQWLRPNFKSTTAPLANLDAEIAAGKKTFETKALESALDEARRALVGADAPELENPNETTLRESIQMAADELKTNARLEVAAALMREKFEKAITEGKDPAELVGLEFARLKNVEALAKDVAITAPAASPTTMIGQALLKLRKFMNIDEPPGGKANPDR
jgi:hypothetical protein